MRKASLTFASESELHFLNMVKDLMLNCRLEQVWHDKMRSLIAFFLESAKFKCSFTLEIKCREDIPMYDKFVLHEKVNL